MNPTSIWYYKPKNSLEWCYWQLKVGRCENELWDFGYTIAGGGSPCCIGTYSSKEEAIEQGTKYFIDYFKNEESTGMCGEKFYNEAKRDFSRFKSRLTAIEPSQTNHIISIPFSENALQTSLF